MGILKQSVILVIVLAVAIRISKVFGPSLPVVVDVFCRPDFKEVENMFRSNIEEGSERGAAISVYFKGEKVIDLWGGYADIEAQRPWTRDTMTQAFSCTKGVAAVVVAKMVQQGYLDYSKPVSYYWADFAQNNKGNITVKMLLSHQAGLVLLDDQLRLEDFKTNMTEVQSTLAFQQTVWPAGSQFGYHAITYGLYVDRLIQLADPKGRDTETFFQEEIAQPFGIDFHMNSPLHEFNRVARLYPRAKWQLFIDAFSYPRYLKAIYNLIFHPESLMARCMSPVKEFSGSTSVLNNPQNRDITVSSLTGTGTARGLAKLYGIVANGGTDNQHELLSADMIIELSTPVVSGEDMVLRTGDFSRNGPGTMLMSSPLGEDTVGHSGHGGQVAHADISNHLGIAYLSNHLTIHGVGDDPRFTTLETAIYNSVARLKQS